ncbi:MAG: class I SAM-dependent methyltransferase [Candidatus Aminicenantes bacterium]|nr:class I SAM-dependent methyltransferase [Candidatus Aminicenantes bacterium]
MYWQDIIQKTFNAFGFEIHKSGRSGIYSRCFPYPYSTYSPWFGKKFQKRYAKIKDHTIVKEDRCYILYQFASHCFHLPGDFAECGVYKGGTAHLIALLLKEKGPGEKRLFLFDTFSGMPEIADEDPSHHKTGDFGDVTLHSVKNYLRDYSFIEYYPGVVPETFKNLKKKTFAFVHIDIDLYQSAKDCCAFFYDRISKGGILLFDDYGFAKYEQSERKAVDEFFHDKPEQPICLRTGQCFIIKR